MNRKGEDPPEAGSLTPEDKSQSGAQAPDETPPDSDRYVQAVQVRKVSGPLPPPEILREYNEIIPGAVLNWIRRIVKPSSAATAIVTLDMMPEYAMEK